MHSCRTAFSQSPSSDIRLSNLFLPFSYQAPTTCNPLLLSICHATSVGSLNFLMKTQLFFSVPVPWDYCYSFEYLKEIKKIARLWCCNQFFILFMFEPILHVNFFFEKVPVLTCIFSVVF